MPALLSLKGVTRRFGGLVAVDKVDLELQEGWVCGLIGPNGAGKTTLFNLITGAYPTSEGTIRFRGVDITNFNPNQRVRTGISRTYQNIRLFRELTVEEHILVGFTARSGGAHWDLLRSVRGSADQRQETAEILNLLGLWDKRDRLARELSYADQRRVEIGRALATRPKLLLLDEPAAGMNPVETEALHEVVKALQERGLTILLIDHDMPFVMGLCRHVFVLDFGRKIAEGMPAEVQQNPLVLEAYLGAGGETDASA